MTKGGNIMPTYIVLFKFTEQGIKGIKDIKEHQEKTVKKGEARV
jgi:uncharacterized protein with GYD domain